MNRWVLCIGFLLCVFSQTGSGLASTVAEHGYYTTTILTGGNSFQNFTWTFGASQTGSQSDNETSASDNESQGDVSISAQAKTFDNETGSYMGTGNFFHGTWEAAEVQYSSFYAADIYTYYSFLFFGVVFAQSSFITGYILSETTIKSSALDSEQIRTVMPFFGILIPSSAQNNKSIILHGY